MKRHMTGWVFLVLHFGMIPVWGAGWTAEVRDTRPMFNKWKSLKVWVEGDHQRVEYDDPLGRRVLVTDGRQAYRYLTKAKSAESFIPQAEIAPSPWKSESGRALGPVTEAGKEKVGGWECRVQTFETESGYQNDERRTRVKEWIWPEMDIVVKRESVLEDQMTRMELAGLARADQWDPALFTLPSGMAAFQRLAKRAPPDLLINRILSDFSMAVFDRAGETLSREFLLKGRKAAVINFFATWCKACRHETPDLVAAYKKYGPQGVAFVSIDTWSPEETDARLRGYVTQYGIPWPVLLDQEEFHLQYTRGIPVNVVVDGRGRIRAHKIGVVDARWFDPILDAILKENP